MRSIAVVRIAPPPPVHMGAGWPPARHGLRMEGWLLSLDGNKYIWVGGRSVRPPRMGAVWVHARWVRHSNGWVFVAGRWR
jgi:hypothetical protein